jgi:hypothetical protein
MIKKAYRATEDDLAKVQVEIFNKVQLSGEGSLAEREEFLAALEQVVIEASAGPYVPGPDGFLFPSTWEPPHKPLRDFAKKFPKAKLTLISDAFHSGYWIGRAVYEGGKTVSEDTLTFNDGAAFEALFKEIHGKTSAEWRKANEGKVGPVRGGFAWGSVEGFDPEKSELGKAEGQL